MLTDFANELLSIVQALADDEFIVPKLFISQGNGTMTVQYVTWNNSATNLSFSADAVAVSSSQVILWGVFANITLGNSSMRYLQYINNAWTFVDATSNTISETKQFTMKYEVYKKVKS